MKEERRARAILIVRRRGGTQVDLRGRALQA